MDKQLSSFLPRNGPIVYRVYFLRFFATQPTPVTPPWETVRFLKLRFLAARALRSAFTAKKTNRLCFLRELCKQQRRKCEKRGNFSLRFFRIVAQSTKSCTKIEKKKEKKNEEIQRWLNLQEFIGWFSAEWRMAKNVEEIFSHVGARWVLPTSRRSFVWKISWKTCLCGDNTTSRVEVPV